MKRLLAGIGTGCAAAVLTAAMAVNVLGAQISQEEAKKIALNHAQVDESQVAYIFAESDFEDGRLVYDVEFFTTDFKEYDYEISREDGSILGFDYDAERARPREGQGKEKRYKEGRPEPAITADQAKETALMQAGLEASQVSRLDARLDYDDGQVLYEGKFFHGSMEYEFEVDAVTGALIDWDVESIYD